MIQMPTSAAIPKAKRATSGRRSTPRRRGSLYGAFGSEEGLFEHYIAGPGAVSELVGDLTLDPLDALGQMLQWTIAMQSDPA